MNNDVFFDLYRVICDRKVNPQEGSYTCYLYEKGIDKILKKIGEEAAETIIAAKGENKEDIKNEVCDLIFHVFVMLCEKGVPLDDVVRELEERSKKLGNLKQMKVVDKNT